MRLLGGGKTARTLRRATEGLLQEPTDAMMLRGWYVHGSRWLLEGFGDSAPRLATDDDRHQVGLACRSLADKEAVRGMLRVGAWTLAGRCVRATDDHDLYNAFRADFGVETPAEQRIADFVPEGHDGDNSRFARISLESVLMAGGADLDEPAYGNLGMIAFWNEASSSTMINAKKMVDDVIEKIGLDGASRVLQHCSE
jgi:hypothetical protein